MEVGWHPLQHLRDCKIKHNACCTCQRFLLGSTKHSDSEAFQKPHLAFVNSKSHSEEPQLASMAALRVHLTRVLVSVWHSIQLRCRELRSMLLMWCKSLPGLEATLFCNSSRDIVSRFLIKDKHSSKSHHTQA